MDTIFVAVAAFLGRTVRYLLAIIAGHLVYIAVLAFANTIGLSVGYPLMASIGLMGGSALGMGVALAFCYRTPNAVVVTFLGEFILAWIADVTYGAATGSAVRDSAWLLGFTSGNLGGAWGMLRNHRDWLKRASAVVLIVVSGNAGVILQTRGPGYPRYGPGSPSKRVSYSIAESDMNYAWTNDVEFAAGRDQVEAWFSLDYSGEAPAISHGYQLHRLRDSQEIDLAFGALWRAEEDYYSREFGRGGLPRFLIPLTWLRGDGRQGTVWRAEPNPEPVR